MFKRIFWNGIKAFVPIAVTIAIIIWLFQTIETLFSRILLYFINPDYYFDGLGILVGIVFVFFIGVIVNAWIINRIYAAAVNLLNRLPFVKTVYSALQDFVNFFDKSKQQSQQRAVLIETNLGRVVGFVTQEQLDTLPDGMGDENEMLVYIPLSYQIGGLMVVVPKNSVKPMDIPVNKAMSMVLTAGMTGTKDA